MRRGMLRAVVPAVLMGLLLSGCGFQLQGRQSLSPQMERLEIDSSDRHSDFTRALRRSLEASGATLVKDSGEDGVVVHILTDRVRENVKAAEIVLSQHDKARDAAVNLMRFFEHESCGQCTPCRVGTAKAAHLMEAKKWDQALLEELSVAMADASICGLGQAAPNPIRCVVKHFPHEV